ncbi:MAG: hypothetical protein V4650_01525 [Pseudomonadota bacterium]
MDDVLHDTEVAALLGMEIGTLRNRICKGLAMPPYSRPPGFAHRLWLKSDLLLWIEQQKLPNEPRFHSTLLEGRRMAGRPTKAMEMARQSANRK